MDEIDARFCIEENGAAVRHTPENLIRSAGIKPSTEISPKRVEERIAAMVRQLRLEQPEQSAAGRYHPSISRSQSPAKNLFTKVVNLRVLDIVTVLGSPKYQPVTLGI